MKVTYQRMYPIGQYLNEKIGFEMELGPDALTTETEILESVEHLKKLCDQAHQKLNPGLYTENTVTGEVSMGTPVTQIQRPSNTIEALMQDINSCKDVVVLQSYKFLVQKDQQLLDTYNQKLKELQK